MQLCARAGRGEAPENGKNPPGRRSGGLSRGTNVRNTGRERPRALSIPAGSVHLDRLVFLQVLLRIERRHAAAPGRGDGLLVKTV